MNISQYVLCGELYNRGNYSTHGYLAIDGWDVPLILQLTGNCCPDLKGKGFRFQHDPGQRRVFSANPADLKLDRKAMLDRQIGPTGIITADDWVRTFSCTIDEFIRRSQLGEQPPTEWKRRLYIEWYGQHGRMVAEIADPVLEYLDERDEWRPLPGPQKPKPPDVDDVQGFGGAPSITMVQVKGDKAFIRELTPEEIAEAAPDFDMPRSDLEAELARHNRETERRLRGDAAASSEDGDAPGYNLTSDDNENAFLTEMEKMEDALEGRRATPLVDIFGEPRTLPAPDAIRDEDLESVLKSLLAQLALFNVGIDVCEHYSPRRLYRWLVEKILVEERFHPELRGSGWVSHFMTHESCPDCDREAGEDYHEMDEQNKREARDKTVEDGESNLESN